MFDVVHQWICLGKLYKLTESFFQISESFFELTTTFYDKLVVEKFMGSYVNMKEL